MVKLLISISCCLFLFINPINAQKKKDSADKIYDGLGYKASIPHYENKSAMNTADMAKIANAYRLNSDTENAEFWYSQIIESTRNPQHFLYYAQALQSNGRFDMAKKYFLEYDEMVGSELDADHRGKLLADAIDQIGEFRHLEVKMKNEADINTEKLDFSPTYYKEGIIFVSTRETPNNKNSNLKDVWINDNFMTLFFADKNENKMLANAQEFSLDLTTQYHEGPLCFSKDGEKIYFTRNDFVKNKRRNSSDGTMKLQIYMATLDEEHWTDPVELPFNMLEYNEAHPTLSPDGNHLYFSSDRPGGLGGMDLYVSAFEKGMWQKPVNLGDKINTAGNEVFPFIHDDGTMYFASNGWGGLGGLDVFSAIEEQAEVWSKATNIGTPFNSPKDDFGFIMNVLKTEGYLTSARKGGKGQDDIYSFKMPNKLPVKMKICAFNEKSNARMKDVEFQITEEFIKNSTASITGDMLMMLEKSSGENEYILKLKQQGFDPGDEKIVKAYNTDENGEFETYFKENRNYIITASIDGFLLSEEKFQGASLKGKNFHELCLPMKKMDCMSLNGFVEHKKYGNFIPGVKVTLINLCTGEEEVVTADEKGYFNYPCVSCGCDFIFKGEKNNFKDGSSKQNTKENNCNLGSNLSTIIFMSNDIEEVKEIKPTYAGVEIKEGVVIELENIYYDFDKYYIRDDAKDELDNVVKLMTLYPSMIIELSSHTDARATSKYNEKLSRNRAKSAVQYIISRGIEPSRLVPMGYGERLLKNVCADDVDCTEEEHQRNRRTEIKVLQFDKKEVKVKYIDNAPEKIDRANPNRKKKKKKK